MPINRRTLLWCIPGAALLLLGSSADILTVGSSDGFGRKQLIVCLAGIVGVVLGVLASRRPESPSRGMEALSIRKRLGFSLLVTFLAVVVAETVCSVVSQVVWSVGINQTSSFWIFEKCENPVQFDPIRGYRLPSSPSRTARVTRGITEYVGQTKGNAQGFPDADDFTIPKPSSVSSRYVVFGDSNTAAQFLDMNWPEYVEEVTGSPDDRWQLLNFSTDGGGLANWWSNFVHIVIEHGYEFDGAIFAVYHGNLQRGFSVAEHRGYSRHMFGRVSDTWDPVRFPRTLEDAKRYLKPLDGHLLETKDFDAALRDKRLRLPKKKRSTFESFWITHRCYSVVRDRVLPLRSKPEQQANSPLAENMQGRANLYFSSGQLALIEEIRECLKERDIRATVFHLPSRKELLGRETADRWKDEARVFAQQIGATFVDGCEAFDGLTPRQVRDDWLRFDGHWGQGGSDRFASFVAAVLRAESP